MDTDASSLFSGPSLANALIIMNSHSHSRSRSRFTCFVSCLTFFSLFCCWPASLRGSSSALLWTFAVATTQCWETKTTDSGNLLASERTTLWENRINVRASQLFGHSELDPQNLLPKFSTNRRNALTSAGATHEPTRTRRGKTHKALPRFLPL